MAGLDVLRGPIDAAAALGAPAFYSISGGYPARRSTDEAYAALIDAVAPVVAYGRSRGVRVAIENSSVARRAQGFVHGFADAAELARETGLDICLELQNVWYERDLQRLFRDHAGRLALVQVSDFAVGGGVALNRRVPGDGDMPLEWLLQSLLDAGYQGVFDLEVMGPAIEEEGYASAIDRAVAWLSERLTRWGA
jgi:sugar phosphate isomerase/epimerase